MLQSRLIQMLPQAHVEVKHRIPRPHLLQPLHRQPLEVAAQRTGQQGFAKATGTAQEHIARRIVRRTIHQFRLINIHIISFPQFRKGLDSYRI